MKAIPTLGYRHLLAFILGIIFLYWPMVVVEIFPIVSEPTLPSVYNMLPGIIGCILILMIRCPYSRLLCYVWMLWFCVGTINTIASSFGMGNYYSKLDLHQATQIYLWACVCYFIGLVTYERLFAKNEKAIYGAALPSCNIQPLVGFFILLFPLVWLISMYLSLGYIPILRYGNIVNEMYNISYGPLYPYSICIVISILYASYQAIVAQSRGRSITYTMLAFTSILISLADGKRAIAMVAISSLIGISFRLLRQKTWTRTVPIFFAMMMVIYVGILLSRIGNTNITNKSTYKEATLVGVEFRDFVYTVNYFKPGEIKKYSWGVSTLASMANNLILQIFNLDKEKLTDLDSAHAWAKIWRTTFGIRTGIVSELWFAYGGFAMPILFFLGLLSGFIIKKIRTLTTIREILFLAAIFGLLFLNVCSQSTFTFGVLPVFFYLYLTIRLVEHFLKHLNISVIRYA